jgi:hypothetical protein
MFADMMGGVPPVHSIGTGAVPVQFPTVGAFHRNLVREPTTDHFPDHHAASIFCPRISVRHPKSIFTESSLPIRAWNGGRQKLGFRANGMTQFHRHTKQGVRGWFMEVEINRTIPPVGMSVVRILRVPTTSELVETVETVQWLTIPSTIGSPVPERRTP